MSDKNDIIYILVEHKKTLWTALIVLIGGIATLLLSFASFSFNTSSIIKFILLILGFIFLYFLFEGILQVNKELAKYFK